MKRQKKWEKEAAEKGAQKLAAAVYPCEHDKDTPGRRRRRSGCYGGGCGRGEKSPAVSEAN